MNGVADWPISAKALAALFALLLLGAFWSILASTVFLAGTRMLMTHKGIPLFEFWSYHRFYGFSHPRVGLWLKIAAGVATAVPVLLFVGRVVRKGFPGFAPKALHGMTRWASRGELVAAELYAKSLGLYVGRDSLGRYLKFGGPDHIACYAPTRSGKGVGLVIPNALLYPASLVALDVKKEIFAATAGIRTEAGQKVFLFDPLAPDGRTARYNPFSYVRRDTIDAFEDVQRIAQMVFPAVSGDQAFWTDSARSAFTGAASFLAETPELPFTFGEVLRLLSSVDGAAAIITRIEARRQAGKPYTEATVKALEDYLKGSADLVNSIRKTITSKLSLWFNPRIDAATAASDFDLRELKNSLHAIYVGVTPDNLARLRPLLALFFQQLVDLNIRTLPQFDPKAKHQLFLLLDEFPLLGPMPVLADAFAYVAGYNIRIMLIMQSKSQLRDRDLYGPDKAEAILDNCGLEVVFGTKNLKLSEELSARLGYDTVEASSRSGPLFWRALKKDKLSTTESDQKRALLLPQEIVRLKPHESIIIRPGMFPIRARRIRYFREALFSRLLRKPPAIEPIEVVLRMDQGKGFEPIAAEGQPAASTASVAASPAAPLPSSAPGYDDGARLARPKDKPPRGAVKAAGSRPALRKAAAEDPSIPDGPAPDGPDADAAVADAPFESGLASAARSSRTVADHGPRDDHPVSEPILQPHQSDALLGSIAGSKVDLTNLGIADGKAAIAAFLRNVPTVASLNRGRSIAAE